MYSQNRRWMKVFTEPLLNGRLQPESISIDAYITSRGSEPKWTQRQDGDCMIAEDCK